MLTTAFITAVVLFVYGCDDQESATDTTSENTMVMDQQTAQTENTMAQMQTAVLAGTQQTMCPVMEGPIDENIFIEYEGQKVYFCCSDCEAMFLENPEEYIAKLPQFQD